MLPLIAVQSLATLGALTFDSGLPYPEPVSIGAALAEASRAQVSQLRIFHLHFIIQPIAAVVLAALLLRLPLRRRAVVAVCVARLLAGGFTAVVPLVLFNIFFAPFFLLAMLTGGADGEFYQEGFPLLAASGFWVWYQLAALVRDVRRREPISGECTTCGYDIRSLDGRSGRCPECGHSVFPVLAP
jgi:hypothetical protein